MNHRPPVLPPHRISRKATLERLEKQQSEEYWTKHNIRGRLLLVPPKGACITLLETCQGKRGQTANEALESQEWRVTKVGEKFGKSWATHWFKLNVDVPDTEMETVLLFDASGEVTVWKDGIVVGSLVGGHGRERRDAFFLNSGKTELLLELACNGLFGVCATGINPPDPEQDFELAMCELAVFDREAWDLAHDYQLIYEMAKELPENSTRGNAAIRTANEMINAYDPKLRESWAVAREVALKFLTQRGEDGAHIIHAFGHCHIDTMWLWPLGETRRKCARSWVNVLSLVEEYPDLQWGFTLSQAAQLQMVEQDHPELFSRVRKAVNAGKILLVGGSWIEMDGNVPSGESFIRQFLHGQRYLESKFGRRARIFWLPDTFGYSSQLPQIMASAGMSWFVTQKLSWNLVNKMPQNSFEWEGLDGTTVLTHFPTADTYCAEVSVAELLKSETNNRSKDRANASMMLFGYGDGGGGPTREMLERLKRVSNLAGLPRVKTDSTPEQFFEILNLASKRGELKRWRGELYFELHQGTFTTHSEVKRRNLRGELDLRNVELFSTIANLLYPNELEYPARELDRLWKLLLVNQFHDTLPGSSIGLVYEDTHKDYDIIENETEQLLQRALSVLTREQREIGQSCVFSVFNSTSWRRCGVVEIPILPQHVEQMEKSVKNVSEEHCFAQLTGDKSKILMFADVPPFSTLPITVPSKPFTQEKMRDRIGAVRLRRITVPDFGSCMELSNIHVSVLVQEASGGFVNLVEKESGRNVLEEGSLSNRFLMFDDLVPFWDAWDTWAYSHEKVRVVEEAEKCKIVCDGPLRASVEFDVKLSETSTLKQVISLDAGACAVVVSIDVDWNEEHKFLKTDFTLGVHAVNAQYGTQFGYVTRPTHMNTSWDEAKYEVPCHGFVHVGQWDLGVAILTGAKYGASVYRNGARLSLLRAPKAPDAEADMGIHSFQYAILPYAGRFENHVVREARAFQMPPIVRAGRCEMGSWITLDGREHGVIVEAVKAAEDGDGSIIVRLSENYGGASRVVVRCAMLLRRVCVTNVLEDVDGSTEVSLRDSGSFEVDMRAFGVMTLRIWCDAVKVNGSSVNDTAEN